MSMWPTNMWLSSMWPLTEWPGTKAPITIPTAQGTDTATILLVFADINLIREANFSRDLDLKSLYIDRNLTNLSDLQVYDDVDLFNNNIIQSPDLDNLGLFSSVNLTENAAIVLDSIDLLDRIVLNSVDLVDLEVLEGTIDIISTIILDEVDIKNLEANLTNISDLRNVQTDLSVAE